MQTRGGTLLLLLVATAVLVASSLPQSTASGWPQATGGKVSSSPALGDLDGDGGLEVIIGSEDHKVYAWQRDGTLLAGWPQVTGSKVRSSPSVGDLDGDGGLEVIVGSDDLKVYAWHGDGTPVAGWPQVTRHFVESSPALGDLDGDGGLEVIAGCWDGKVYAWHGDGAPVAGWPQVTGSIVRSSPALGDLDGDGGLEVVIGSEDHKVYAWHGDGTPVAGWPQGTGHFVRSSPALGDLDGDGSPEVVVASFDNKVYAWHADGTLVGGWPRETGSRVESSPALGDLDGDETLEVVVGSDDCNVHAWHGDGTPVAGWPRETGHFVQSSPGLGDLDGDGYLEIVVGSFDHNVYAWNRSGATIWDWPKETGSKVRSSPAIGDLDGDGAPEVVVGSQDHKVYAWFGSVAVADAVPWLTFHRDMHRTGEYPIHSFLVTTHPPNPTTVASGGSTSCTASYSDSWGHGGTLWSWDDGVAAGSFSPAANVQNPTYAAPPNTTDDDIVIILTVSATCDGPDPVSDADSATLTVQPVAHTFAVTANAPSPAGVPSGGSATLSASFADSRPGHSAVSWSWHDGGAGGTFSPGANVQNPTYTAPANTGDSNVVITLTVSASCDGPEPLGDSDSTTLTVFCAAHTVVVTANAPSPPAVASGGSASLSASFADSRPGHSAASWSWQDGGAGGSFGPSANVQNPTYTAPANTGDGNIVITLTVSATCDGPEPLGDSDSTTLTVAPVEHEFGVYASVDPAIIASGGTVSLSANHSDTRDHSVSAWSWDDGGAGGTFTPSSGARNPSYTAPENPGFIDLIVVLTVGATCEGPDPLSDSDSTTLAVEPAAGGVLPQVLLVEHPNERGAGPTAVPRSPGVSFSTWPIVGSDSSYTWKQYLFEGSGDLWIQVCGQSFSAYQNSQAGSLAREDKLLVIIDGVILADVNDIQSGSPGSYQWLGGVEEGRRTALDFLATGLAPGAHALVLQASMSPIVWWVKVYDLEQRP